MPAEHDIRAQLEQLGLHRGNVQFYRRQALAHGGLSFAPIATQRGLAEAYAGIARCKAELRGWEVPVEDAPEDQPESEEVTPQTASATELEQAARDYRAWVLQRYGQIQILGMHEPIPLEEIFTDIVLERNSAWLHLNLDELRQRTSQGDVLPAGVTPRPGQEVVERARRLYLLGKPGSGKSTFLRYLACTAAEDMLPILVDLKEWARDGNALLDFLAGQIAHSRTPHARALLEQVLSADRALLLFDGLDEVAQEQGARQRTIQAIRDLAARQPGSQMVITCRTAADEHVLEGFTYAEVADFSSEQVRTFAEKWFRRDPFKRERFLEELARPAHAGLRDLARTPLLLTLLCLSFEASMRFSERRVDLYEAALDLLLQRWDASRSVERDGLYRALPLNRKRQLLARIALETFERGEVFVRRADLERRVTAFLARLPDAPPEEQIDTRAVLAAIEAQHGLLVTRSHNTLAFSHLTFQEYFAARAIVENPSDAALTKLIEHAPDPRWREVLLMVASLLDEGPAERFFVLFMKAIHPVLISNKSICDFRAFNEIFQQNNNISINYKIWNVFVSILFNYPTLILYIKQQASGIKELFEPKYILKENYFLNFSNVEAILTIRYASPVILGFREVSRIYYDELEKSIDTLRTNTENIIKTHNVNDIIAIAINIPEILRSAYENALKASENCGYKISSFVNPIIISTFELAEKRIRDLTDLLNQVSWLQRPIDNTESSSIKSLYWLNLAYHIGLHGDADRSAGLAAFWRSALANLPAQPPEVQALRAALEACAVPTDNAPVEEWQAWLLALRDVLVAHQHIGLEWAAGRGEGGVLGQYLATTALLHECLEQATVANREQILEQLLTVPAE